MERFKGNFLLLLTAIIWGTSFVSQKLGMNYVEPFTLGGSRFLLGAVVLIPVILISDYFAKRSKSLEAISGEAKPQFKTKDLITGGTLCGASLFFAASAQQYGIVSTTAGKAGFITALYIVLVPLFGIFMKKKVGIITWIGVAIAVIGLYMLTIKEGFTLEKGDAIVLLSTIFWALQIIIVGFYVDKTDGLKLSFVQFLSAGIFSAIAAFVFETPKLEEIIACAGPILYLGIVVVGVAYTLQILGQKHTGPTAASIILSLESVFAVISGAIFLKEAMSPKELLGCVLMFLAVILVQINPKDIKKLLKG